MGRSNNEGRKPKTMGEAKNEKGRYPKALRSRLERERRANVDRAVRDTPKPRPPLDEGLATGPKTPDRPRTPTPAERAIDRARQGTREAIAKRDKMKPYIKERAQDAAREKMGAVDRIKMDTSRLKLETKRKAIPGPEKTGAGVRDAFDQADKARKAAQGKPRPDSFRRDKGAGYDEIKASEAKRSAPAKEIGIEDSERWKKGMQRAGAKNSIERRKKIVEGKRRPWPTVERKVRGAVGDAVKSVKKAVPFAEAKLEGLARSVPKAALRSGAKSFARGVREGIPGVAAAVATSMAAETPMGKRVIKAIDAPISKDLKRAGSAIEKWREGGGPTVTHPRDLKESGDRRKPYKLMKKRPLNASASGRGRPGGGR